MTNILGIIVLLVAPSMILSTLAVFMVADMLFENRRARVAFWLAVVGMFAAAHAAVPFACKPTTAAIAWCVNMLACAVVSGVVAFVGDIRAEKGGVV